MWRNYGVLLYHFSLLHLINIPAANILLSRAVLDFSIRRKHEHPLTELHIDIGKQAKDFGAGNLADLFAELLTALRNQVLSDLLDHLHTLGSFGQLSLSRRQHALQPNNYQIAGDQRPDFIRASPHKLLLELDDGVPDRVFHGFDRRDYKGAEKDEQVPRLGLSSIESGLRWAFRSMHEWMEALIRHFRLDPFLDPILFMESDSIRWQCCFPTSLLMER